MVLEPTTSRFSFLFLNSNVFVTVELGKRERSNNNRNWKKSSHVSWRPIDEALSIFAFLHHASIEEIASNSMAYLAAAAGTSNTPSALFLSISQ